MNVFFGRRFAIWADKGDPESMNVAIRANVLLERGFAPAPGGLALEPDSPSPVRPAKEI